MTLLGLAPLAATAAEEGKKVIIAMLIVGLIFIGVIALGEPRYALGIETIYEGYLLHYGRTRLFAPEDQDAALLLGDYLYAHGLVRIEEVGSVEAVSDLAELIALCAYLHAEEIAGDGPVWAATAAALGRGELEGGRSSLRLDNDPNPLERLARARAGDAAVDGALVTHRGRLR